MRTPVPLAPYTTLGLGGPAAILAEPADEAGLIAAVRAADDRDEPVFVLGGGSNVVIADAGFPGTVIRVATRGMSLRAARDVTAVTVAAGENWDDVVARCVAEGLAGLECLSGIPGLAGATPIQNVGAYGQEVADTITSVRAYDREGRRIAELPAAACGFGYRTSCFKRTPFAAGSATGRFVVLAVTFRLTPGPQSGRIRYPELGHRTRRRGGRAGAARRSPLRGAEAAGAQGHGARRRRSGHPQRRVVLHQPGSDRGRVRGGPGGGAPGGGAGHGRAALPGGRRPGQGTGRLADRARRLRQGLPGARRAPPEPAASGRDHAAAARISSKHTLALINPGEASTASLLALAGQIRAGVHAAFGVTLVIEPVLVGSGAGTPRRVRSGTLSRSAAPDQQVTRRRARRRCRPAHRRVPDPAPPSPAPTSGPGRPARRR